MANSCQQYIFSQDLWYVLSKSIYSIDQEGQGNVAYTAIFHAWSNFLVSIRHIKLEKLQIKGRATKQ